MPDRLDTVTVALSLGDVTIGWETRRPLMARLQHVRALEPPRHFEAVAATEPSNSTPPSEPRSWACSTNGRSTGRRSVPEGLIELRDELSEDLADLA